MTPHRLPPRRTLHPFLGCSLLGCLAATLACGDAVGDEAQLAALTPDERRDLCEEIAEALPSAGQQLSCADGNTVSFDSPEPSSCSTSLSAEQLGGCTASAGDVRACVDALVADPCHAFDTPPPACLQLQAAGCAAFTPSSSERCAPLEPQQLATFEGIYELAAHTRNDVSCAASGASILARDSERLFVVVASELFGMPLAALRSCSDMADCQREIAELRESSRQPAFAPIDPSEPGPELTSLFTCGGADASSLLGRGTSAGTLPDAQCALSSIAQTLQRTSDGTLRFERTTFAWTERAHGSGCVTGALPAANVPCSELEVIQGRFVSAL
ncbi:MAG: hypothetical protein RL033_4393 [Pseudomonadota bacterium]|jgi:hypothetical protein